MRSHSLASLPLLLLLSALGACGDEASPAVNAPVANPPAEEPAKPVEETPPEVKSPIVWEKCPLETGGAGTRAECANVEVPLDWNAPDGKKVTFFVKRVLGNGNGPRQQLWLLQGGPGGAGDGLEPLAQEVMARDDSVDIYIPDHRGTGRSAYLDCPATMKSRGFDMEKCATEAENIWGKGTLATFSTTTAARDVGYVIEKSREKDQKVHVYGVSYGTYWAQRYLQLFPKQADAVTLDSLCQSGLCSLSKNSYWFDVVGKKYLAECAEDAFCKEKLGADPVATVKASIAKANAGTCAGLDGWDGSTLQYVYQWFITSVEMRVMIPSLAYRIVRCNDDDVDALSTFTYNMQKWMGGGFSGFATKDLSSDVLLMNVALSEMEEDPIPTAADLKALMTDTVFVDADSTIAQVEEYKKWPRYKRDEFVGKYADTATPILMMNGSLDPQTPQDFADAIAPHYTKPNQTYVVFPRAAHGVIHQSPTGHSGSAEPCGTTVWRQFVANPTSKLDTSCTSKILGHEFDADWSSLATWMYDRPSLWSPAPKVGSPNGPAPLSFATRVSIENALRRAERDTRLAQLGQRLRARASAR
jgi:pimeloyl-ACP methyl ester carboxylesterase